MIIIRESFVCKPGQAGKLSKLMHGMFSGMPGNTTRVMTDFAGEFNTVVLETELPDLGAFDARMKEYSSNPKMGEQMVGYTDMYLTGKREIFRTVD